MEIPDTLRASVYTKMPPRCRLRSGEGHFPELGVGSAAIGLLVDAARGRPGVLKDARSELSSRPRSRRPTLYNILDIVR